ncbi:MAG: hypothetical protein FWD67_04225 [Betaproteobacteria bacterium]|nr:hypothetical protein [Betaproteobacteria bacterium]
MRPNWEPALDIDQTARIQLLRGTYQRIRMPGGVTAQSLWIAPYAGL